MAETQTRDRSGASSQSMHTPNSSGASTSRPLGRAEPVRRTQNLAQPFRLTAQRCTQAALVEAAEETLRECDDPTAVTVLAVVLHSTLLFPAQVCVCGPPRFLQPWLLKCL